jgi:hypothetical protein
MFLLLNRSVAVLRSLFMYLTVERKRKLNNWQHFIYSNLSFQLYSFSQGGAVIHSFHLMVWERDEFLLSLSKLTWAENGGSFWLLCRVSVWPDLFCGETVILLRNLIDPGLPNWKFFQLVLGSCGLPDNYPLYKYLQIASFRAFTSWSIEALRKSLSTLLR